MSLVVSTRIDRTRSEQKGSQVAADLTGQWFLSNDFPSHPISLLKAGWSTGLASQGEGRMCWTVGLERGRGWVKEGAGGLWRRGSRLLTF